MSKSREKTSYTTSLPVKPSNVTSVNDSSSKDDAVQPIQHGVNTWTSMDNASGLTPFLLSMSSDQLARMTSNMGNTLPFGYFYEFKFDEQDSILKSTLQKQVINNANDFLVVLPKKMPHQSGSFKKCFGGATVHSKNIVLKCAKEETDDSFEFHRNDVQSTIRCQHVAALFTSETGLQIKYNIPIILQFEKNWEHKIQATEGTEILSNGTLSRYCGIRVY